MASKRPPPMLRPKPSAAVWRSARGVAREVARRPVKARRVVERSMLIQMWGAGCSMSDVEKEIRDLVDAMQV